MTKTAVIGLGRMGLRHVSVVQSLDLELVGAADQNEDVFASAVAQGVPKKALFNDAKDMLRETRPECVVIGTTGPSHAPLLAMALDAGAKYILCEKPMGISLKQCDEMVRATQSAGAHLAINHQMRFMDQYTIPKDLLDSEAHGGMTSMTVHAGNFGMSMNGSHYIEAFRFMSGDRPARVSAWFSDEKLANPRGPQFEDRAGCIRIESASGKRFYMDIGSDQGHGMHVSYMSRNGRIDIDELAGDMREVVRLAEHRDAPTTRYGMPYATNVSSLTPADAVAPTRAVLSALLANENYPSGEEGRLAIEVLVAAYHSAEQGGKTIDIANGDLDRERRFPWA